jgi:hypothetical protein
MTLNLLVQKQSMPYAADKIYRLNMPDYCIIHFGTQYEYKSDSLGGTHRTATSAQANAPTGSLYWRGYVS